jgi:hypothetical protein
VSTHRHAAVGAALGIVLGLSVLVARARPEVHAPRAQPTPMAGRFVADDVGPLREVVMHYVPELEPAFAPSYRDFLATLPEATRIVFVVRRAGRPALEAFLGRIDASRVLARARVVEIDAPLGIWSKDRALVLSPERTETRQILLIPPRPRVGEVSRPGDWYIVPALAAALPESFEVRSLPVAFDAGDFAISGGRVLVDVNLFARNRSRGFRSPAELRDALGPLLGRDVVMLGTEVGDVPRHHMSMYMAPLGDGTVLVGDPEAGARIVGRDYVPGEVSPETGAPLRADFSPETVRRFERAARDLAAAGFRIVRIPTVPFDDKTYFAYTNGVYETREGRRTAWVPSFDVPALDAAAREVYEGLGFHVAPVSVRAIYTQHGTIGCMVNVVARGA